MRQYSDNCLFFLGSNSFYVNESLLNYIKQLKTSGDFQKYLTTDYLV